MKVLSDFMHLSEWQKGMEMSLLPHLGFVEFAKVIRTLFTARHVHFGSQRPTVCAFQLYVLAL